MIDNLKEVMQKETEERKKNQLLQQNHLKVHRVVLEHKRTGHRNTVYLAGFSFDNDLTEYKIDVSRQLGKEVQDWGYVEQTGNFHVVNWFSQATKEKLINVWLPIMPVIFVYNVVKWACSKILPKPMLKDIIEVCKERKE